jgi:UDP-xylose/UDP-N-acetylglucosamine transporter B4
MQVFVLWSMSLLNNWAFAFDIPLTVQIVFRSGGGYCHFYICKVLKQWFVAGPAVSVLYGYWLLSRRYNTVQLVCVFITQRRVLLILKQLSILFVTYGVILTSLSRPQSSSTKAATSAEGYGAGIALLTVALFLTGYLGYLQEKTYRTYKPWWKEGLFYTVSFHTFLFVAVTHLESLARPLPSALHSSASFHH